MKRSEFFTALILFWFIAFFCPAQEITYDGPGFDEGLFAIGWTADGKRVAYGLFEQEFNEQVGEGISRISLVVQDLVTDEIVWRLDKSWYSSEEGCPQQADQAWYRLSSESEPSLNYQISQQGITIRALPPTFTLGEVQIYTLPDAVGTTQYTLSVSEGAEEYVNEMTSMKDYEVFMSASGLGEKKISAGRMPGYCNLYVRGFMINPDESRIAVILYKSGYFNHPEFNTSVSEFIVVGCHLKAGFKMTAK